jgi:hypothetical protein
MPNIFHNIPSRARESAMSDGLTLSLDLLCVPGVPHNTNWMLVPSFLVSIQFPEAID